MDWTHFGIQLVAPLPIFGGLVRDRLLIRVGHPQAVTLHRDLPPNYGAILTALESGLVLPVNPRQRLDDLRVAVGELLDPFPPASESARPLGHRYLRRLK